MSLRRHVSLFARQRRKANRRKCDRGEVYQNLRSLRLGNLQSTLAKGKEGKGLGKKKLPISQTFVAGGEPPSKEAKILSIRATREPKGDEREGGSRGKKKQVKAVGAKARGSVLYPGQTFEREESGRGGCRELFKGRRKGCA